MNLIVEILRKKRGESKQCLEKFTLEIPGDTDGSVYELTVVQLLEEINRKGAEPPVEWECSCLQKKCGACAMVVNGKPMLACDARVKDVAKKSGVIRLEPLRKFPVVADLIVDRSIMRDNLKTIGTWMREDVNLNDEQVDDAYEASRCLQCGCCLEICPNYYAGSNFLGMSGFVPTARLINSLPEADKKNIKKAYRDHIYEGCGKSLACRDICPAGIDIDGLLIKSNRIAIWKK